MNSLKLKAIGTIESTESPASERNMIIDTLIKQHQDQRDPGYLPVQY
jgi:hypothetical protein